MTINLPLIMNLHNDFIERHIGPSKEDSLNMLKELNYDSLDQLIDQTIPKNIKLNNELNISKSISEPRYLELIKNLGKKIKTTEVILALDITIQYYPV